MYFICDVFDNKIKVYEKGLVIMLVLGGKHDIYEHSDVSGYLSELVLGRY